MNKNFFWNITGDYKMDYLTNVWQLTGADGVSAKGISQLSFQNPAKENVNMSYLIMLTSDAACEKLASAYKSYFGKDYEGGDGYKNIGYKFVTEFVKNVSTWHSSDTTAVKTMTTMTTGQVVYGPLNKVKDYPTTNDYHKELAISGWNTTLEGFDSYFCHSRNDSVESFYLSDFCCVCHSTCNSTGEKKEKEKQGKLRKHTQQWYI